ncbi:MAG: hypothetical protein HYV08_04000, partial [Deltaproteobacteria bacterium]|nr:hypothetical protein [Deltaproteobacteria bacterium]
MPEWVLALIIWGLIGFGIYLFLRVGRSELARRRREETAPGLAEAQAPAPEEETVVSPEEEAVPWPENAAEELPAPPVPTVRIDVEFLRSFGRVWRAEDIGADEDPVTLEATLDQVVELEAACEGLSAGHPRDAFLSVGASWDPGGEAALSNAFAVRLGQMYREWARTRRMRLDVLEETGGDEANPYRLLLAVSG